MSESLSPKVLRQLDRLRATKRKRPKSRKFSTNVRARAPLPDLPEPIRSFIEDYDWPDGFVLDQPSMCTVCIDFAYDPLEMLEEGPTTFMVGLTTGGAEALAVKLDDPRPSDPTLYVIDHETPDEIKSSERLSDYLKGLVLRPEDETPDY